VKFLYVPIPRKGSGSTNHEVTMTSEELALPRLIRCKLPRLRCHGHSLLLSSYLCRIKRTENSSCSACGHSLQPADTLCTSYLTVPHPSLSGAPSSAPLPFLTSGADLGAWPNCWVSVEFFHVPIPRKGSGSTATTMTLGGGGQMIGPFGKLVSPFRPTDSVEGQGLHHHDKATRHCCRTQSVSFCPLVYAGKNENSSCSTCGHQLQDLTHLILDCSASEPI